MAPIERISIPLPHVGSVNAWLLRGEPLALIDTGPRSDAALDALEQGLLSRGVALEDIELVIGTHHHHDHVGLAATIRRRSGARIAVSEATAGYGARYGENVARDRIFARELMRGHGVPEALAPTADALWDYIDSTSEGFPTDIRLRDGDVIRAGGRDLRVVTRPGHSFTDTLLVDSAARAAFVGDHLLATISPNTEITRPHTRSATDGVMPDTSRSRPRLDYVRGIRRTAAMPVERIFPGHGQILCSPGERVRRELAHQRRRCRRIAAVLEQGPASAFEIARVLWSETIVREQPLLVVWEALGHLDILLTAGVVRELRGDDGGWCYALSPLNGARAGGRKLVLAA